MDIYKKITSKLTSMISENDFIVETVDDSVEFTLVVPKVFVVYFKHSLADFSLLAETLGNWMYKNKYNV